PREPTVSYPTTSSDTSSDNPASACSTVSGRRDGTIEPWYRTRRPETCPPARGSTTSSAVGQFHTVSTRAVGCSAAKRAARSPLGSTHITLRCASARRARRTSRWNRDSDAAASLGESCSWYSTRTPGTNVSNHATGVDSASDAYTQVGRDRNTQP